MKLILYQVIHVLTGFTWRLSQAKITSNEQKSLMIMTYNHGN